MVSTRRPPPSARGAKPAWKLVARPDALDPRDRPFAPNVGVAPAPVLFPAEGLPVRHQGDTNACTGFALSLVVEHLLRSSGRERDARISPYMLYSMARRYDEFPGSVEDEGSSLRGALKGWFKHGACALELFDGPEMPPAQPDIERDWWYDAVRRPLGAYYRIDPKRITDMHAALNEVGILYASCGCHAGWDEGAEVAPMRARPASFSDVWPIPVRRGRAEHAGHAFAIVGYNEQGFLIQNSWGADWGSHGYAVLSYDDWVRNAMDCWVAQLGVVTTDHQAISRSVSLRTDARSGRVALAASRVLRNREIAPFVINMGHDGALSNSGEFRTTPDDVRAIADVQLAAARERWKLHRKPVDVCIVAHGGLMGEKDAADVAARWIPALYERRIFPVFLMWETGFMNTLLARLEEACRGLPRAGGLGAGQERWWNQRLERLLARPGTASWRELKDNAEKISRYRHGVPIDQQAGAVVLYQHFKHGVDDKLVRMHVVGHSAGCIVAGWMIDRLVRDEGLRLESVSFMAPALRLDDFRRLVRPHLVSGAIGRYQQFHLSARAEADDPSCGPYRRSLLHLVSESFEGGARAPLVGLQRDFERIARGLPRTTAHVAPGPASEASTHDGFDDDDATLESVIRFVTGR